MQNRSREQTQFLITNLLNGVVLKGSSTNGFVLGFVLMAGEHTAELVDSAVFTAHK